ncbi:MAG: Gfo/Idh/MocA family oxidoreductase [Candidatus Vogelbacteria bacterium]|nr:Gfo/Idh/MocA family oxidoreductase [Candidatus Vogelbacteria bacterium]
MENALTVLVIGAGMYVCGRGTDGFGTVLPALYQAKKQGLVGRVVIAATSPESIKVLKAKVKKLNLIFKDELSISYLPDRKKRDPEAYKKAFDLGINFDCAIISVPDKQHAAVTSYLLRKKLHCLVVKPLAPTLKEVKQLIELQLASQVYGAVEFHKRYDRSNLKLKDVIREGKIGDPLYFLVEYSQRKSIPLEKFKHWVNQTNIFQYLGIHYVDIIYFATGARPIRVMAIGQKNYLKSKGVDNYDSIQCVVEWRLPNGKEFSSTLLTNWIDPEKNSAMSDQKIKIIGTRGSYEADQKDRGITMVTDDDGIEVPNPDFSSFYGQSGTEDFSFQGYGYQSIRRFLADVVAVKEGTIMPAALEGRRPTFSASIVPTAVIEAANKSLARGGKWLNVKT